MALLRISKLPEWKRKERKQKDPRPDLDLCQKNENDVIDVCSSYVVWIRATSICAVWPMMSKTVLQSTS